MSHEEALPPGHYHHLEPEQAYHSAKLGMWIFLATEVHLFGGLFCTFAIFRWKYLDEFEKYADTLNWQLGLLNTLVLLTSSYTMVRAVDAAQKGFNKKVCFWTGWTIFFAFCFMYIKYVEYSAKLSHGIYPWTHVFYGLYFTMTGLHGLHIVVGIGLLAWIYALARKERFKVTYYGPVEVVGLYWHLVDVIWIYLFPLLYLLQGLEMSGGAAAH